MARSNFGRRDLLRAGVGGAALLGGVTLSGTAGAADTGDTVDVALYVDGHVHEAYGYDPALAAQTLLGRALEYNEIYDYAVTVVRDPGFDVRDLDSTASCDDILPAFDDWLKAQDRKADHEDHHLIHHSDEALGGCAWPRVSVGWGETLGEMDPFDPDRFAEKTRGTADDALGDALQVTMHEISHTLGIGHGDGMHYAANDDVHGDPSLPGGGGDVYTTPQGAPFDGENDCGQPTEGKPGWFSTEYADAFYWYDCAGAKLRSNFDRRHLLTVEGADDGDWEQYHLEVSGDILEQSTACDASVNDHDDVRGDTVDGYTYGGRDSFVFTGEILEFTADDGVSVFIDCEPVLVDSVGNNAITLDGSGSDGWESYQFTVAGGLRRSRANGASINDGDRVAGRTADGRLYAGADSYRYWGGVLESGFDPDGATVRFDRV